MVGALCATSIQVMVTVPCPSATVASPVSSSTSAVTARPAETSMWISGDMVVRVSDTNSGMRIASAIAPRPSMGMPPGGATKSMASIGSEPEGRISKGRLPWALTSTKPTRPSRSTVGAGKSMAGTSTSWPSSTWTKKRSPSPVAGVSGVISS